METWRPAVTGSENDRGGPDPEVELDVLLQPGETVSMPGVLDLTKQSVVHLLACSGTVRTRPPS
jgi:hypothetical protein